MVPATFGPYRDQFYVRLAENCVTYSWILTGGYGREPVMDSSFVEKGKIGGDLFQGLATVRCSELGCWNFFAPILDYTSAKAYADSIQKLHRQRHDPLSLRLYYPIRLKNFGPYSLDGLRGGISHIELHGGPQPRSCVPASTSARRAVQPAVPGVGRRRFLRRTSR